MSVACLLCPEHRGKSKQNKHRCFPHKLGSKCYLESHTSSPSYFLETCPYITPHYKQTSGLRIQISA